MVQTPRISHKAVHATRSSVGMDTTHIFTAAAVGMGATLLIDVWASFLRRAFGVASLDPCMLGRWVLHLPFGRFVHERIAAAPRMRLECPVGWAAHYLIG